MPTSRVVTITTAAGLTLACGGLPDIDPRPPPPPQLSSLTQEADGTCTLYVPANCPPPEEGTTCNPPPPLEQPCPQLESVHRIERQPDGTCRSTGWFECPDGWSCSEGFTVDDCPPQLGEAESIERNYVYGCVIVSGSTRTQTADCPPQISTALSADYRIEENGDGTCTAWYTGSSGCPEGASCNPPPPADVPCPPRREDLIPPAG